MTRLMIGCFPSADTGFGLPFGVKKARVGYESMFGAWL